MFLDSGAFIARYFPRDQHHAAAVVAWSRLDQERLPLVTTQFVIAETLRFASHRSTAAQVAYLWRDLLTIPRLTIESISVADQQKAILLLRGDFGAVDCTSFVVMKRLKLRRAFTFDHHFAVAGFEVWPV